MNSIPQSELWERVLLIDKGWSKDEKYHIVTTAGDELLLRVAPASEYDKKKSEFDWMERLSALNILLPMPLEFGRFADDSFVYSLLTWMRGDDLDALIEKLEDVEAYNIGVRAGEILHKIHSVSVDNESIDVYSDMQAIYRQKLTQYRQCGIVVPGESKFLAYIESAFPLIQGVEACFLHGDYHVGNMIISDDNELAIIDFNRYRLGDPCRDFSRMAVFSRMRSEAFVRGQIDGYWGRGNVPAYFFARMAFYVAFDNLFSVLWASSFGGDEVEKALSRAALVLDDFDNFNSIIPTWYR